MIITFDKLLFSLSLLSVTHVLGSVFSHAIAVFVEEQSACEALHTQADLHVDGFSHGPKYT